MTPVIIVDSEVWYSVGSPLEFFLFLLLVDLYYPKSFQYFFFVRKAAAVDGGEMGPNEP